MDTAFNDVVEACATSRRDGTGTWIVDDMKKAYSNLHQHRLAHSVEVWHNNDLVGGLYGVSLGKVFFGESMFSRQTDASKIALVYLVKQLTKWNFKLIDCQVYSEHLGTLGAECIKRRRFTELLNEYCGVDQNMFIHQHAWQIEIKREELFNNE
jgi:leucyl/phenylalanyl-tRNA--protein transferase